MDILKVSKLGFGTSQIGGPSLINGRLTGARPISRKEALNILSYAFENGINFFDTSDKYGNAEELLGKVFSKRRDKVVIATKCGIKESGGRDFSLPYIKKCLDNSLRVLKTDYIDIFQLVKPDPEAVTDGLLKFFTQKIKEGKIRRFGISIIGDSDGREYIFKKVISSFQVFYNLLFVQSHGLIKKISGKNKFVIIRSPLNSGILSGSYSVSTKFVKIDPRSKIFCGDLLRERLAKEVLGFALNFILSNLGINVVIPAASKLSQLQDYLDVFNNERRFNSAEVKEIMVFLQHEIIPQSEGQSK
jgi:aryl-alcohol dehydrogenase-like predicted oxidoreductase